MSKSTITESTIAPVATLVVVASSDVQPRAVTHGQVKGLFYAAHGVGLELCFPEGEVTPGDTLMADLQVAKWYPNGHEHQADIQQAIARRVSIARMLADDSLTFERAAAAIDYAKAHKGSTDYDVQAEFLAMIDLKAEPFVAPEQAPKAPKAKAPKAKAPKAPKAPAKAKAKAVSNELFKVGGAELRAMAADGDATAQAEIDRRAAKKAPAKADSSRAGAGRGAFGTPRVAAKAAVPGKVAGSVADLAAKYAAQGMTADQIASAIGGLRAAGLL